MGFGIRIAPGVRVSASPRGLRVGIGPRYARIHVGSGRPTLSTGAGPVTLWAPLTGGRRSGPPRRSFAAARQPAAAGQADLAAASAEDRIGAVERLEHQLVTVHQEEFTAAVPPVVPPPSPVDEGGIRRRLRAQAEAGIGWWRFGLRRAARRSADGQVAAAVAGAQADAERQHQQAQAAADEVWRRLVGNDPPTVLAALEEAFEDNASPAAAIDCEGSSVSVVVVFDGPDLVPDRKFALTPGGRPTLHQRTKTERNQLYVQALASAAVATVKEAFAVAPAVQEVRLLVVRKEPQAATAADFLAAVYAGRFTRQRLAGLDWSTIDPLAVLLTAPDALFRRRGVAGEVVPIDLSGEPELADVLAQLRAGLATGELAPPGRQR